MKRRNNDSGRLERLLADGWKAGGGARPDDLWQAGVMARVRAAAATPEPAWSNGAGRLALRISIAAAAAAAILVAWTLAGGLIPYEELAMKALDEPLSMIIGSPFV
ncbi:MAG: hypothetical protein PHQ19_06555 [Candidatus Krumholzibacteria bacterium]|nr:hypothetical protein [Candidatus Krumholzibacteria bacterium]